MEFTRDIIEGFSTITGSGIATLILQNSSVFCDNGATGRALNQAFNCITSGCMIDNSLIEGQDIVYFLDDYGLALKGFVKYDDWLDQGQPEVEIGKAIEV